MSNLNKGVLGVELHQFLNNTSFFGNSFFKDGKPGEVVFFPGCSFNGYSPNLVLKVYDFLSLHYDNLGVCTSCCGMPSKLIKSDKYDSRTHNLQAKLQGVTEIITCCPNCTMLLSEITDIKITSIYTILEEHFQADWAKSGSTCVLHDPCPFRKREDLHVAVRNILSLMNVSVEEFKRNKASATCCGKSNMLFVKNRDKSVAIARKKAKEVGDKTIISYCFSCVHSFKYIGKNSIHLLELVFNSYDISGNTWGNRIKLQNLLKSRLMKRKRGL